MNWIFPTELDYANDMPGGWILLAISVVVGYFIYCKVTK